MPNKTESLGGSESERQPIVQEFEKGEWPTRTIAENESRPPVTPELREKMDREIFAMGKLMEGSNIWWQLDGSLNISLREIAKGGDYIGMHKDIDFSVFADDLPRLKAHVESKGYGLFYYYKDEETGKRRFEEITGTEVKPKFEAKIRVIAVDREKQSIDMDADMVIAGPIISRRSSSGEFIGWRNYVLPKEWMTPETVHMKGVELPLSHPARFVYFKLFSSGKYHEEDLEKFVLDMKAVSMEDLTDISRLMEEFAVGHQKQHEFHEQIARDIAERVVVGMTPEALREAIRQSTPQDFWEKVYGAIVNDDPIGVAKEADAVVDVLSEVRPLTYESFLETLNQISYLEWNEKNLERVIVFLDSLKKRRVASES